MQRGCVLTKASAHPRWCIESKNPSVSVTNFAPDFVRQDGRFFCDGAYGCGYIRAKSRRET